MGHFKELDLEIQEREKERNLQREYLIDKCIYCDKKRIVIMKKVPKGREQLKVQTYLHCTYCKKDMVILNDDLKESIKR